MAFIFSNAIARSFSDFFDDVWKIVEKDYFGGLKGIESFKKKDMAKG